MKPIILSMLILAAVTAQAQDRAAARDWGIGLPPPPQESRDIDDAKFRFDRSKSAQENQAARAELAARMARWQRELRALDRAKTAERARSNMLESIAPALADQEERERIVDNLEAARLRLRRHDLETVCGDTDDSKDVEFYDGSLGPTVEFVRTQQPATGQIQWKADLRSAVGADGDPGNVAGQRWCSGTLIADDLFLSAAHCFEPILSGWKTPRRNVGGGLRLMTAGEIAPLMNINFNYQIDPHTNQPRTPDVYPVTALVEYGFDLKGELDYAIVQLGHGPNGELPSKRYRVQPTDASDTTLNQAKVLSVIQHPNGLPKRIAAGSGVRVVGTEVQYSDVDTYGGASGSGVIEQGGRLVGVHTNGGCDMFGGHNSGVALTAIRGVSAIIK